MILLTRRVLAEGRSLACYLDCLCHLAKAPKKRLNNGLNERDFARLRCPKNVTLRVLSASSGKTGFPAVGSHSERENCGTAALSEVPCDMEHPQQQKRAPPAIAGHKKK